ncbi:hydroxyphenylacetyl-CoA thioesterase PaaI [Streptomyces sp. SID13726]|uniref:hydroxyphenylacetyl-CoA thioesterase PaaI n=1 Tax=Streptomyces sp. SID13726 TaxID=2706058 RepID=UPI0013B9C1BC|nr:hydroxyphenylacetyl-CoA thioesterase PaaI [Streptomyces sp. SID13726]NEB03497.1 hydroxyphenylacetyl-CoA thioesterase PaaI [Streptomyces sp. SID13726]
MTTPTLPPATQDLLTRDHCARTNGITVHEAGPGYSLLSMTVRPDMLNSHGICHGGLIFLLADTALAYAANDGAVPTVSTGASILYLSPARPGDTLTAACRATHQGPKAGVYDVTVTAQDNTTIATFRGQSLRTGSVTRDR